MSACFYSSKFTSFTLCVCRVHLVSPSVFFDSSEAAAVITWVSSTEFGSDESEGGVGGAPFDLQVQLYPDGSMVFAYRVSLHGW